MQEEATARKNEMWSESIIKVLFCSHFPSIPNISAKIAAHTQLPSFVGQTKKKIFFSHGKIENLRRYECGEGGKESLLLYFPRSHS
jgi:hypothetical protein